MGRSLNAFYQPVLAVHAPSRPTPHHHHHQPSSAIEARVIAQREELAREAWRRAALDETEQAQREGRTGLYKWRDAPFDVDEERDDAVKELFLSPDDPALSSAGAGPNSSSVALAGDDCIEYTAAGSSLRSPAFVPPAASRPPRAVYPQQAGAPMTPSSGVFHSLTLPLALPPPHERLGTARRAAQAPSASSAASEGVHLDGIGPSAGHPVQLALPPAPRLTHRQPPESSTAPRHLPMGADEGEHEEGEQHPDGGAQESRALGFDQRIRLLRELRASRDVSLLYY